MMTRLNQPSWMAVGQMIGLLLMLAVPGFVLAQRTCGMDSVRTMMMGQPAEWNAFHERMDAMRDRLPVVESRADCDDVLMIPVAAHFQNTGIPLDCAIDMALSQVEAMNADFGATNADLSEWFDLQPSIWPGIAHGESCIQFCLATLDHPAGFGLSDGDYAVTLDETDGDNDPAWAGYLNFWVRTIGGGTLGYSPLGGQGNGDGVTVDPAYFGTVSCGGNVVNPPYDLGRTMTHEVGHYFSLDHPWGFGGCGSTDGIADTPVTDDAQFGCPSGQTIVNCTEPILWPTYMEYCDDACLFMFSAGQVDQMEAYAEANLQSMLTNSVTTCQESACLGFSVSLEVDHETCSGNDGSIEAAITGGTAPFDLVLSGVGVSGSGLWTGLGEGTYIVQVEDGNACYVEAQVSLVREEAALSLASLANEYCSDGAGRIEVATSEPSALEYTIDAGSSWQPSGLFVGLNAGTYVVEVRNDTRCEGSLTATLANESDLVVSVESQGVTCDWVDNGLLAIEVQGASLPLLLNLDEGEEVVQTESTEYAFEGLSVGEHSLTLVDAQGCTYATSQTLQLDFTMMDEDCPCHMYVPNAFSPDRDGLNEALAVEASCPVTDYELVILDRQGRVVFMSNDVDQRWNGTAQGAVGDGSHYVPCDVYGYRMRYRWGTSFDAGVEPLFKMGSITVIR